MSVPFSVLQYVCKSLYFFFFLLNHLPASNKDSGAGARRPADGLNYAPSGLQFIRSVRSGLRGGVRGGGRGVSSVEIW